jgi:hypothetical protein
MMLEEGSNTKSVSSTRSNPDTLGNPATSPTDANSFELPVGKKVVMVDLAKMSASVAARPTLEIFNFSVKMYMARPQE